jgi:hypothetical protein
LVNDIHEDELKIEAKLKEEPTPVTVANILGGKKKIKIKYNNLRALVDTGSSGSIAHKKYASKTNKDQYQVLLHRKWSVENKRRSQCLLHTSRI